ncbi:MAG: hypothetical protein ACRDBP_04425, partial [Luteolibacter sp.]
MNIKSPQSMSADAELEAAYNEALRKIGRNLLLFQQAEHLLKRLKFIGSYSSRTGEARSGIETQTSTCHKMTLGQVVNLFVDHHCAEMPSTPETTHVQLPDAISRDDGFGIHFTFGGIDGYPEARRQALTRMVNERNELVHHLLLKIDRNSMESCLKVGVYLDEQRQAILPEIQLLQQNLKTVTEQLNSILEFAKSPQGMAQLFLPEIQQSPLVTNLAAIAAENPDPEAWTPLGPATKRLQDFPR